MLMLQAAGSFLAKSIQPLLAKIISVDEPVLMNQGIRHLVGCGMQSCIGDTLLRDAKSCFRAARASFEHPCFGGKSEVKACTARRVVGSPQASAMRFHNRLADTKPHAGAMRL